MSVNSSIHLLNTDCLESRTATYTTTSVLITNILLLFPLLFSVFYLGLQRWMKQRSGSATSVMSHSDFFTYNMAALELISILGSCLYCFGSYVDGLQQFGKSFSYITSPAQSLFHLFTCVERYLAVVHPITFLGLKQAGPGEVSRDRERVDQSKQRAFHTIVAIMVAQLFRPQVQMDMSVNSSIHHFITDCLEFRTATFILTSMLITNILLLFPLLLSVFYLGLQRWMKQRSGSATSVMSQSDFFTYNMAALELISILGSWLYRFGSYVDGLQQFGKSFLYTTSPAQSLFHLFTCVERYLAVVHPITYLGLKQAGPGEVSRDRERVDQSKQRAFHTIVAIMWTMLDNTEEEAAAHQYISVSTPSVILLHHLQTFSSNMSVNSSIRLFITDCLESRTATLILTSVLITNILLLFPLLFSIFYLGLQRWTKQRSGSATSVMSHSDFFTYNMAVLELITIFGCCLYCFGSFVDGLQQFGKCFFYITSPAQSLFHLFTCVERYLAVFHPITYLGLKQAGPGEVSRDRERVDQSKQRAFHTIVAIMAAQLFRAGKLTGCKHKTYSG
ncbi:hypothetical protein Q8A73_012649 [Channa argus]|nr:hypothetical protein Q8A73_012649 [Channa argus]